MLNCIVLTHADYGRPTLRTNVSNRRFVEWSLRNCALFDGLAPTKRRQNSGCSWPPWINQIANLYDRRRCPIASDLTSIYDGNGHCAAGGGWTLTGNAIRQISNSIQRPFAKACRWLIYSISFHCLRYPQARIPAPAPGILRFAILYIAT